MSYTCSAPVEIGKLTSFSFGSSIFVQVFVIFAAFIIDKKRNILRLSSQTDVVYEGLPEVIFASHGVFCLAIAGGVTYRALHLRFFEWRRFKLCPYNRIVRIFRFSCWANTILSCWYSSITVDALRIVLADLFEGRKKEEVKYY
jgi:hypothetical protein